MAKLFDGRDAVPKVPLPVVPAAIGNAAEKFFSTGAVLTGRFFLGSR